MEFDVKHLAAAMKLIAEEKNLKEDVVQEIVERALGAAYKKDYGDREQEVRVNVDLNSGAVDVYVEKEVVETVGDANFEITLVDAKKAKKEAVIGDMIEQFVEIKTFGRVAAQTAKQVIMQSLRESEREVVMAEYEDRIGDLVNGVVTRVEPRLVRVEVGKAQAIMPQSEQSSSERYFPGQRLKLILKDIEKSFRGPQLIVSRGSADLVRQLFNAEVPEMEGGAVEMKAIAREAGVRTKLAVNSTVQGVDPVGTFVGGHGTRVNAVVNEIGDQEKIDIVVWDENPEVFIASALSPTKVTSVIIEKGTNSARVMVPEDQLSVAIGKGGQNVRLASKLTEYEIDINAVKDETVKAPEAPAPQKVEAPVEKPVQKPVEKPVEKPAEKTTKEKTQTVDQVKKHKLTRKSELESNLLEALDEFGE